MIAILIILFPLDYYLFINILQQSPDGTVTFEDVKGFRTDLYKTKKKMVEATSPFKIIES
jgi:hypothetical protein